MTILDEAISAGALSGVQEALAGTDVERIFRWAQLISIMTPGPLETCTLDPIVRRICGAV